MDPENEDYSDEILSEETEKPAEGGYSAKAGGKAEVTIRLLTQEEFDAHELARKAKEAEKRGE